MSERQLRNGPSPSPGLLLHRGLGGSLDGVSGPPPTAPFFDHHLEKGAVKLDPGLPGAVK